MKFLLDANALIALSIVDHTHHDAVETWLADQAPSTTIVMCPITQGALLRILIRSGLEAKRAQGVVSAFQDHPRYEFCADSVSFAAVPMGGVIGHRQVTDAYLAHLARDAGARLATFDQGLAQLHPDVADLIE